MIGAVVQHPVHENALVLERRAVAFLAGRPRWLGVAQDPRAHAVERVLELRTHLVYGVCGGSTTHARKTSRNSAAHAISVDLSASSATDAQLLRACCACSGDGS